MFLVLGSFRDRDLSANISSNHLNPSKPVPTDRVEVRSHYSHLINGCVDEVVGSNHISISLLEFVAEAFHYMQTIDNDDQGYDVAAIPERGHKSLSSGSGFSILVSR